MIAILATDYVVLFLIILLVLLVTAGIDVLKK
jgi:hypothetical protein